MSILPEDWFDIRTRDPRGRSVRSQHGRGIAVGARLSFRTSRAAEDAGTRLPAKDRFRIVDVLKDAIKGYTSTVVAERRARILPV